MSSPPSGSFSPPDLNTIIVSYPACGGNCFLDAVNTESKCSATDIFCICTSQAILATTGVCVEHSCTIPETLRTQNLTNSLCGNPSEHDQMFLAINYVFVTLASLLVALRFLARLIKRVPLWWDDYSVLISVVVAIGFTVICGVFGSLGVGMDLWAVPQDNISTILILLWSALLCYAVSRCFVRISISLFLLRIFRVTNAARLIKLTLAFNIALSITFVLCIIFQCTPVPYFWTGWDGLHDGFCINQWVMFISGGCISTSLDICLVLLPIRWIFQLQFSRAKKIVTLVMFSLGIVVVATSIMRLVSLYRFTHSHNVTRNLPDLAVWGGMELYVAIICACIPSLRPLMKLVFSRIQPWTSRGFKLIGTSSSGFSKYFMQGSSKSPSKNSGQEGQPPGSVDLPSGPRNVWLTTTIQQRIDRPSVESQANLTRSTILSFELEDHK
jgi:hypothetical protein